MRKQIQSAEDFNLKRVVINSDRFNTEIDITNITVEINIYENLYSMYLTGSIMIVDDNGLFSFADFQGTERLTVEIGSPDPTDATLSKTFIMNKIDRTTQTNDHTKVLAITLIEDVLFYNNVQSVSKSYEGSGEKIIENVLSDKLNKQLYKVRQTFKNSFQAPFRILAPYVTPFEIAKMALSKMTTDNGSPYFLYSTLYNDNLFLADLDTINQSDPITKQPFVYSQSVANDFNNDVVKNALSIYSIKGVNQEDTMMLAELGAINSLYSITDMSNGQSLSTQFSVGEMYDNLQSNGVVSRNQSVPLFDGTFKPDTTGIDNRGLSDFVSKRFHQVAGGNTYPYQQQINNWTAEDDPYSYRLRLTSYVQKTLLMKNRLELHLPGLLFLANNSIASVGRTIDLLTFKSEVDNQPTNNRRDHKRSGKFVIVSKRHVFNTVDFKHTVSIACSRISNERRQV